MSRHTLATLVAAGLVLVLGVTVAAVSVPYVRQSPGPTVDVLGTRKGEPVVEVDGERTFPTDGSLRLTTVLVTQPAARVQRPRRPRRLAATRTTAVLPYEALYPEDTTAEDEQARVGGADGQQPGHRGGGGADQDRLRPPDVRRGHRRHPRQPVGGRARAPRPHPRPSTGEQITGVQQVFRAVGPGRAGRHPHRGGTPSRAHPALRGHHGAGPRRPGPGDARHPGRDRLRLPLRRAASASATPSAAPAPA